MKTVYRMHRYGNKAWEIQKKKVAGEKAKEPGAFSWVSVAFPGNMIQAAQWLVDAGFGDFTAESVEDINNKLDALAYAFMLFTEQDQGIEIEGGS